MRRDKAIADLNEAIRISPGLAMAHNSRGAAYLTGNEPDRAITDFCAAIASDPRYAAAYSNRGMAYEMKGDFEMASADFTNAIRLDRGYAPAYFNRACVLGNRGEYEKAVTDFTDAIRLNPKYVEAYLTGLASMTREAGTKRRSPTIVMRFASMRNAPKLTAAARESTSKMASMTRQFAATPTPSG